MESYLKTKDYFNTQEEFDLLYDSNLDMLITRPVPEKLHHYYNTESYISHTDQTKTFIDKIYQFIKNYSLTRKYRLIKSLSTSYKSILDIGAGTGDFLKKMKEHHWDVQGVEPNAKARQLAKEKGLQLSEKLTDISSAKFDVISLWHVLEHLPNLEKQIEMISFKLNANGYLIIAVPNYKSYDAKKYKNYWAAYDTPRHLWHFSRTSIKKIFAKHNFELKGTQPLYFDSFYVSLLSEKYKSGKNNYIGGFLTGFLSNFKALFTKEYSSIIYILKKAK